MPLDVQFLGRVDYEPTYAAMQALTAGRSDSTPDVLWVCEHAPVYTQGLAGKKEHILNPGDIPVVATNRGGQVTYHGPGQVVAYPLMDLKRAGYFVKEYVYRIEEAVIRTLLHLGVTGHRVAGAPGIYVRLADPSGHALLPQRPMKKTAIAVQLGSAPEKRALSRSATRPDPTPILKASAKLQPWVSRSAVIAPTTVSRSTSPWTLNPTRVSTPAATPGCKRWIFLQSASLRIGRKWLRCSARN